MTYTLIDGVTLASSASSVTFSSIPAGGDLVLVCSPIDTSGYQTVDIQFNSDTGTNYSEVRMFGDGISGTSTSAARNRVLGQTYVSNSTQRCGISFQIADYSATDKHKSVLVRGDNSAFFTLASAARWANTSAITSIYCFGNGNFAAGSTFYLYGIAKAL